jgi:hypothetical protein
MSRFLGGIVLKLFGYCMLCEKMFVDSINGNQTESYAYGTAHLTNNISRGRIDLVDLSSANEKPWKL